jgi:hypothetical protein
MNFILGSGISGIILKLLDKDNKYTLIGNNVGGQLSSSTPFILGPRILKHTFESEKFVNSVSLKNEKKLYKVGYYYNNQLHDQPTIKTQLEYFHKTRGNKEKLEHSSMNNGESSFFGYDLSTYDVNFLYRRILSEKRKIVNIQSIDLKNKILKFHDDEYDYKYSFESLINTLPLNVFYKLCNINKKTIYEKVIFYKILKSFLYINIKDFDFVYVPEEQYCFHRITNLDDKYYCVEVKESNNYKFDTEYVDKFILNDGILIDDSEIDLNDFKRYNIKFCGRYAQALHNVRIHDIIKIAKDVL